MNINNIEQQHIDLNMTVKTTNITNYEKQQHNHQRVITNVHIENESKRT